MKRKKIDEKYLLFEKVGNFSYILEDKIFEIELIKNKVNGIILPEIKKVIKISKKN